MSVSVPQMKLMWVPIAVVSMQRASGGRRWGMPHEGNFKQIQF